MHVHDGNCEDQLENADGQNENEVHGEQPDTQDSVVSTQEENAEAQHFEEVLVANNNLLQDAVIEIAVKQENDPVGISSAIEAELIHVLDDANEEEDTEANNWDENGEKDPFDSEEDTIVWTDLDTKVGFPMPIDCADDADALPKQENDRISGNLPFAVKVSFFLMMKQSLDVYLILQIFSYAEKW